MHARRRTKHACRLAGVRPARPRASCASRVGSALGTCRPWRPHRLCAGVFASPPTCDLRLRALARQALDSVSSATWCGSAALGGFLCDRHGYIFTFYITAAIQFAGVMVRALLIVVVPLYEQDGTTRDSVSRDAGERAPAVGSVAPLSAAACINAGSVRLCDASPSALPSAAATANG
jgi:hypothetical protein